MHGHVVGVCTAGGILKGIEHARACRRRWPPLAHDGWGIHGSPGKNHGVQCMPPQGPAMAGLSGWAKSDACMICGGRPSARPRRPAPVLPHCRAEAHPIGRPWPVLPQRATARHVSSRFPRCPLHAVSPWRPWPTTCARTLKPLQYATAVHTPPFIPVHGRAHSQWLTPLQRHPSRPKETRRGGLTDESSSPRHECGVCGIYCTFTSREKPPWTRLEKEST